MDGADKRSWNLYTNLVAGGTQARFVGRRIWVTGDAEPVVHSAASSWRDRKAITAIMALLTGADYWQLRLLRPGAHHIAVQEGVTADAVLVNFICCQPLLRAFAGRRIRLVFDTHNYDPVVYANFRKAARNPMTRLLCQRAIRTSRRALAALPTGTVLVHVSEEDARAWRQDRPDLRHEVVENGCEILPRTERPSYQANEVRQLMFVGSLSAQMNQDGLHHFSEKFWPGLRDRVQFRVVGSNPSPGIAALCRENGWDLWPNVSESRLTEAYAKTHFAVLPFTYGAGSKLKLLEACGRGVPVLSTIAGTVGVLGLPASVVVSDDPSEWRRATLTEWEPLRAATELVAFSNRFSWKNLSIRLRNIIESAPEVTIPRE